MMKSFQKRSRFLLLCILTFATLSAYADSLGNGFVWDDRTYFIENDILPNLKPWQLADIFFHPSNYWGEHLPVRDFLYVLEYNLFGLSPAGYHVVSLGLYVLVCCMVYFFLRNFYSNKEKQPSSNLNDSSLSAFFVTLIFAVYPVHVECVAYISAQKDLLYSLFSLCSIYVFYQFFNFQKRKSFLSLGILSYYLALLSKLTAIALAVFIPLLYLLSDSLKRPKLWKTFSVWIVVNIPVVLWVLRSINISESYFGSTFAILRLPFFERLIRSLKILGAHTVLGIKPYPLSFGYPFDSSTSLYANLLSGIIAIIVIVSLILYFRKDHFIVLGSCLFILFLFPVLQLHGSIAGYYIYDKYLFIPVLGIAIIVERFLRFLPLALNRIKIVYISIIFGLVSVFAAVTITYVPTFRSDIASTRNSYEKFPNWPSSALMASGRYNEAEQEFEKALSSKIYQPLEMYHARKELEKIQTLSEDNK